MLSDVARDHTVLFATHMLTYLSASRMNHTCPYSPATEHCPSANLVNETRESLECGHNSVIVHGQPGLQMQERAMRDDPLSGVVWGWHWALMAAYIPGQAVAL